jgi:hypothetical protein
MELCKGGGVSWGTDWPCKGRFDMDGDIKISKPLFDLSTRTRGVVNDKQSPGGGGIVGCSLPHNWGAPHWIVLIYISAVSVWPGG